MQEKALIVREEGAGLVTYRPSVSAHSAWLQGDHPNIYQFNTPQRILFKKNVITGFCQN